MGLAASWSLAVTPWIMASSVRWLSWISPSALVSEGVSVLMVTGQRANGHISEDEIDKIAHRQPENHMYGLAGHEVGLKPSCACVGLV